LPADVPCDVLAEALDIVQTEDFFAQHPLSFGGQYGSLWGCILAKLERDLLNKTARLFLRIRPERIGIHAE
jgi:hypothetical protein